MSLRPYLDYLAMVTGLAACAIAAACASGSSAEMPAAPGVIYSYPYDGQVDVPLGAHIVVAFSEPVNPDALGNSCSTDGSGRIRGGLCIRGPLGLVPGAAAAVGPENNVVRFEPSALEPGVLYQVHADPTLLEGRSGNIPEDEPLLSFVAAQHAALPTEGPEIWAINGDNPAAFVDGAAIAPRFPFLDFTTIRLVMSEPLDVATVVYGESVRLEDASTGALVNAALLTDGPRLTIDPVDDLESDRLYRLELSGALLDIGGHALEPSSFVFAPLDSRVDGERLRQTLACIPATEVSYAAGSVVNHVAVSSALIGNNTLAMKDSTLVVDVGNPGAFGGVIPLTVRKGQRLTMEALPVRLGGEIPMPLRTGDIDVQMASDATGYLVRNPFHSPERVPDEELAPLFAHLTFDIVITARDSLGNATINQTVLNVQMTGIAQVRDRALAIDSMGTLDLNLLGMEQATTNMVLRLRTDPDRTLPADQVAPELTATYPVEGAHDFPTDGSILFTFSKGIDPDLATRPGAVLLDGDRDVRVAVSGSTLIVTPVEPLAYQTDYSVTLVGPVRDLAGNELATAQPLGFRTEDVSTSAPAPFAVVAIRPGLPCALSTDRGPCAGSDDNDLYLPFTLPANRPAEVHFNQPLDRATVQLGDACDTGNVRVERLDASGTCVGAVPGHLSIGERTLRFDPGVGWNMGAKYRLVLRGGDDSSCDNGELCGRNGMPLNTDVLRGIAESGDAGGPDIAIQFSAAPPARARSYATMRTLPLTDRNGNGAVDPGEAPTETNRAAVIITGTGGMVNSATMNGPDCLPATPEHEACIYLSSVLPISVGTLQRDCDVGAQVVPACIPVEISPQMVYGTSLSMDVDVALLGELPDQRTEQLVMRIRAPDGQPVVAHVVPGDDGLAEMRVTLELFLDAPSMVLVDGLVSHDLASKPMLVELTGALDVAADGRIVIELVSVDAILLTVQLSVVGIGLGTIDMEIPAGEMKMRLAGEPLKGSRR